MGILKLYEYNNEKTKRKIVVYTNGQVIDCKYYREEKMTYNSYNQYSFVAYLKGCEIPKKVIRDIEKLEIKEV